MKSPFQSARRLLTFSAACAVLLAAFTAAFAENGAPPAVPLRVLILSGAGKHDWQTTTPFLRRLLTESERFDVRVTEAPAGFTAETLSPYDVVVDDYCGPRWGKISEDALQEFVRAGKGLVVTHGALPSFAAKEALWPGFAEMTHLTWPPENAGGNQTAFRIFPLKAAMPEHPIMRALPATFHTGDQLYQGLGAAPGADILATSDQGEPLLIVSSYGKGRVFCTALGHDVGSMEEKPYITTLLRGTEWAATGAVTLPAEIGMPGPKPGGVRVLVITGGHDHEASFYGLFDGWKDLGWVPVSTSKMAFEKDIRAKYDVLVMYDFTRDLEDKEKQNLRDFVESNKGIVVLHHGILDHQHWPWWTEEVVGGRYRLENDGDIPNSTVKFGEEHLITPAGDHPITAGVAPFHVTDETYRGLFISPNITPLLTTTNRTSDHVVGWIGPCKTSKVVFIQLGHDHSPFQHPSYRTLVHNSILWTAGRLN